jgi:hypothetical protein
MFVLCALFVVLCEDMMNTDRRTEVLEQLAAVIARHRLTAPARIALDIVAPLGFIASQVAQFVQPLTPAGRWHEYVNALDDEQGWLVLRRLVDQQDG